VALSALRNVAFISTGADLFFIRGAVPFRPRPLQLRARHVASSASVGTAPSSRLPRPRSGRALRIADSDKKRTDPLAPFRRPPAASSLLTPPPHHRLPRYRGVGATETVQRLVGRRCLVAVALSK